MASMHIDKAMRKAAQLGGAAGHKDLSDLWNCSKRELLEAALHLAANSTDSYDWAIENNAKGAADRLREELATLKENGLI